MIIVLKFQAKHSKLLEYIIMGMLLFESHLILPHHESRLLHTVKHIGTINQSGTNAMSHNCQQVGDHKYFHLQDME